MNITNKKEPISVAKLNVYSKLATQFKVSKPSVCQIVNKFQCEGSVKSKKCSGRERITIKRGDRQFINLSSSLYEERR